MNRHPDTPHQGAHSWLPSGKELQIAGLKTIYRVSSQFKVSFSYSAIVLLLSFIVLFVCRQYVAIDFIIPRSDLATMLYKILDPFLLYLISLGWLIWLFTRYVPQIRSQRMTVLIRSAVTAFGIVLSFSCLNILEDTLLKPFFNVARPQCRLERAILADFISGKVEYDLVRFYVDPTDFLSGAGTLISSGNDTLDYDHKVANALRLFQTDGHGEDEATNLLESILYYEGSYPLELPVERRLAHLNSLHEWRKAGVGLWFSDMLKKEELDYGQMNSCPSGHGLRQILVLFFAILLMAQSKDTRQFLFGSNKSLLAFGAAQILVCLWVVFSRIYGFHHTLFDMLISFLLGNLLLIMVLMVSYLLATRNYHRVLNSITDLIYETDKFGIIRYCNPAFAEIFRIRAPEDLIGTSIEEFYINRNHRNYLIEELENRGGTLSEYFVLAKRNAEIGPELEGSEPLYLSLDTTSSLEQTPNTASSDDIVPIRGTGRDLTNKVALLGAFYQIGTNNSITFCTPKFAEILGYESADDLIGKCADDVWLNPHHRRAFCTKIAAGPETDHHLDLEAAPGPLKVGQRIILRSNKRVSRDQAKNLLWIEGAVRDVSHKYIDLSDGHFVLSEDGEFVFVSPCFCEIVGCNEGTLLGQKWTTVVVDDDQQKRARMQVARELKTASGSLLDLVLIDGSGTTLKVTAGFKLCRFNGYDALRGFIRKSA